MDASLIRPFLVSTHRVFERMLGHRCVAGKPMTARTLPAAQRDVDVIVHLDGAEERVLVWRFPESTAAAAVLTLTGQPVVGALGDTSIAMNQVARMIVRSANRFLQGRNARVSAPVVRSLTLQDNDTLRPRPWIVVPFNTAVGGFVFAMSATRCPALSQPHALDAPAHLAPHKAPDVTHRVPPPPPPFA